jgi:LuxR family maltose regulon positive regulatory protein
MSRSDDSGHGTGVATKAGKPARAKRAAPTAAPRDRTALLSFPLVEAKLSPPASTGSVSRKKLTDRLVASRAVPVVRIVAQVGYGKTTLLAEWARRDRRPFAWVSVDDRDNDPVVLLTYVATALDRVEPIDPSVFRVLASPGASIWSRIVPKLGAELVSIQHPVVIVLDDVQFLHRQESLDAVAALAQHIPPGSQLVLSGRDEGQLPLGSLRASGKLVEVGTDDLRMNAAEARVLLRSAAVRLSITEATGLTRRTEGWAAGLYLAALSMQAGGIATPNPSAFRGSDRFIVDYLHGEHLSRLSRTRIQFLTRTSVLGKMCAPLCDAVLERTDSARFLQSTADANLFLVPLDRERRWYRYHHLFREFLQSKLERDEPELIPELNRRAADWCEENGDGEAAIEYALAGGDLDRVARLVVELALPAWNSGRAATGTLCAAGRPLPTAGATWPSAERSPGRCRTAARRSRRGWRWCAPSVVRAPSPRCRPMRL